MSILGKSRYIFLAVSIAAFISASPHTLSAQQISANSDSANNLISFTAIHGEVDQGVSIPQFIPVSALQQDKGALTEIKKFRSLTGIQSWRNMAGQGTIRYGNDQSRQGRARIEVGQPGRFMMDATPDQGESISLRRDGNLESVSRASRTARQVDVRDAAAGIFLFPRLEEASFPQSSDLLIDDGAATVDGRVYHRITLEYPPPGTGNANHFSSWIVVDLYFDPSTHLLEKSATTVHSLGSSAVTVRVISYDNYQQEGATRIPMSYRETLNGQLVWTLQLSQVELNGGVSDGDFTF